MTLKLNDIFYALLVAALALVATPGAVQTSHAHDAPLELIILETMTLEAIQQRTAALRSRLGEIGYRQGDSVNIRVFNAEKDKAKGIAILNKAIAQKKPDLVITVATVASQSGREVLRGTDIPQIFMFVSDPVGAGVIDSIGSPSGENVAGHVHMLPRDIHLNMIMRLLRMIDDSDPLNLGLLYSSYPSSVGMKNKLIDAAKARGDVTIHTFEIEQLSMKTGLDAMLAQAEQGLRELESKADFIWLGEGPLGRNAAFVNKSLEMAQKPIIAGASMDGARSGILITLDSNPADDAREAALLVNAVLNGQDPSQIPVMRTSAYRIGINMSTAKKLGIEVPPDLRAIAGRELYW